MRYTILVAVVAIMPAMTFSNAATATTISEAIKICNANPSCAGFKNKDGSWGACVADPGSNMPHRCVNCPAKGKGNCTVAREGGGKPGRNVVGALQPLRGGIAPPKLNSPPKGAAGLGTVKTGGSKQAGGNNQTIQMQHVGGGDRKH